MADFDDHSTQIGANARPRYRRPIGLPMRGEGRRTGAVVSVLVHAVILFLLIFPFFMPRDAIRRMQQGAGGAGPAGGGGGGTRGTGGQSVEKIQFVRVSPTPVPTPTTLPPVVPPRSEEHTSELQSRLHLVCRLLL